MNGKLSQGQMFMVGFNGLAVDGDHPVVEAIVNHRLGGVILFDRNIDGTRQNIQSFSQLRELTSTLQGHAEIPLFVAVDQEGGQVCRLKEKDGFPSTVSAALLGQQPDTDMTRQCADTMARSLAELGVNFNLAPVVDLALNEANAIISRYERSFGRDPQLVVQHAMEFVSAHHRMGVACCLKHFPGHGSSTGDSHLGFVDISESWQERELEPYREMFGAGFSDAVMTAHVVHRQLDRQGLPATLSEPVISRLLRDELGFSGIIVSDDLQMKAITDHWGYKTAVQKAVLAGVDLLIIGNNLVRQPDAVATGVQAVEELLDEGKIDEQRIRQSVERITNLKRKIAGEVPWTESQPIAW